MLRKLDWDLEIRKRYAQPLAVESGEFPDIASIESRAVPIAYEAGLVNGVVPEATQLMTVAVEAFSKELLSTVFSRTRSNGPGNSGSAGFGAGPSWIQTHNYKLRLRREEAAFTRGELSRDKNGLLPVEAKAASERAPIGMADLGLAMQIGDCNLGSFPIIRKSVMYAYRDGELDNHDNYTWLHGRKPRDYGDFEVDQICIRNLAAPTTKVAYPEPMDIDEEPVWEGATTQETLKFDAVMDMCLAIP